MWYPLNLGYDNNLCVCFFYLQEAVAVQGAGGLVVVRVDPVPLREGHRVEARQLGPRVVVQLSLREEEDIKALIVY